MKTLLIGVLVAVIWMASTAAPQPARKDYNSGGLLYRTFCTSCHGENGRGDGPVADLGPRPPDLTRLREANAGVFPRARVEAALQDTRRVAGHQVAAMPNWREVLRKTERADERTLSMRLEALIAHVESLQK